MKSTSSTLEEVAVPASRGKRKPLNRAKAIREFCAECVAFHVHLVNTCPDRACPLWEWRRGPGGPEPTDVPIRRQVHEADAGFQGSAGGGHGRTP